MENGRKKLKIEVFFELFFGNFKRILTANLLFAIPSAAVFVGYYFLYTALFDDSSVLSIIFLLSSIILLYPFYAGVVMIVRNIVKGDGQAGAVKTYFTAVRQNSLPFLLHGFFVYAATVFSYFAIPFYIRMLSASWIMYGALFFCILVVLMALYASFYLPLMSLTYDIKFRYLYKNCFLMSFGEFKHNLAATFAIMILFGVCLTLTIVVKSVTVLLIVLSALWALFLPAAFTFCYTFFIYQGMVDTIASKDDVSRELSDRISELQTAKPKPALEEEDFSDIDISRLKDTDDFIFHNGRMVKQSTLLKILREKEAKEEVDMDE